MKKSCLEEDGARKTFWSIKSKLQKDPENKELWLVNIKLFDNKVNVVFFLIYNMGILVSFVSQFLYPTRNCPTTK